MRAHGRRLLMGRVLGVLSQLAGISLLLASAWLIVRAAQMPPVMYLMVTVVSVRFFGLARSALRYAERLLTHDAAFAQVVEERVAVHRELDRVAPAGMDRRRRGDLVSRVVSDVDSVLDQILRVRTPWVVAIACSAAVVAFLAFVAPAAAMVVALQTVVSMALVRGCMAAAARSQVDTADLRGAVAADLAEAVRVAPDLIALGAAGEVAISVRERTEMLGRAQRRGVAASAAAGSVVQALTGVAMAAAALVTPDLSPVLVGVVVLAPLALLEPLEALADAERLRAEVVAARRRLTDLVDAPTPVHDPDRPSRLSGRFDLVAEDLVVGWEHATTAPVSFHLPAGEAMVVTGRSGVGKSTLAMTMARFVDPVSGGLALGGVDLRDLTGDDVRSTVGVLAQDEVVFDTTIRENLRIADPGASDIAMWEALGSAGLGGFVDGLPRALDTPVGEAGVTLSGGERQRLCLARLLLGGHRVLIVDEPTEHLDEAAGDALVRDLLDLTPQRSIIVISHAARVRDAVDLHVPLRPVESRVGR